ncbi:MAG: DUF4142 domain-containing protein [Pseudomonadota bacterium]|nr:DUF4142 domain-containing protein [Pseudomonadota bacterium]
MTTGKTFMLLSAAAVVLTACGPKADQTNTMTTTTTTASETNDMAMNASVPALSPAQTFVNTAAASDAFEIATSKLALDTSKSASVKAFANQMIKAHTGSTDKLKSVTAALNPPLTPDPVMSADQQATITALKAKTGPEFDTAFATAQVNAHQAALDGLKAYGASGDVAPLKDFANGLVPIVTAHVNMAKDLK